MGANFSPAWMDYPTFVRGPSDIVTAGIELFTHIIMMEKRTDSTSSGGQSRRWRYSKRSRKRNAGSRLNREDEKENLQDIELCAGKEDDFDVESVSTHEYKTA